MRGPPLPRGALYRLGSPAPSRADAAWQSALSGGTVIPESAAPARRWAPTETPTCAVASHDGRALAAGFDDGTVTLWDGPLLGRERTLVGHASSVSAVGFAPDGATLVTASDDGEIRVWDVAEGALRRTHSMDGPAADDIRFGDEGHALLAAADERVRLWSVDDGRDLNESAAHLEGVERVVVSSAGWAASSDGSATIFRWDLATGARSVLSGHHGDVTDLAVAASGAVLAATSGDHSVRSWDEGARPARLANGLHYDGALCAGFSPSGAVLLVGDRWGQIRWWRANDGELNSYFHSPCFAVKRRGRRLVFDASFPERGVFRVYYGAAGGTDFATIDVKVK